MIAERYVIPTGGVTPLGSLPSSDPTLLAGSGLEDALTGDRYDAMNR